MINGLGVKVKINNKYFDELKKLKRLSRDELLKMNLSEYTKKIENKYSPYHTKDVLCEEILTNSGLRAYKEVE